MTRFDAAVIPAFRAVRTRATACWRLLSPWTIFLSDHPSISLYLILAIGGFARLLMILGVSPILWSDSLLYYREADDFLARPWLPNHEVVHTPLYPAYLAAFLAISRSPFSGACAVGVQSLLGLGIVTLYFFTARTLFSQRTAFWSALLLSLNPVLLYYERVVQTEVLFTFLLSLLCFLVVRATRDHSLRIYLQTGATAAALALTRPVAQIYIGVVALTAFLSERGVRKKAAAIAGLIAVYFVLVLPWMYVNHRVFDFWGISKGSGVNLFFRVLDVDRTPIPETSNYPEVREAFVQQLAEKAKTRRPNRGSTDINVRGRLEHQGFSPAQTDDLLFKFAVETILANPGHYVKRSLSQLFLLLFDSRDTVNICRKTDPPHLCCLRTVGVSRAAIPNDGLALSSRAQRLVLALYETASVRMCWLSIFALLGVLFCLLSRELFQPGKLFLFLTGAYYLVIPILFNVPEDRYRLVAEPIVFIFGVHGASQLLSMLVAIATRIRDRRPSAVSTATS